MSRPTHTCRSCNKPITTAAHCAHFGPLGFFHLHCWLEYVHCYLLTLEPREGPND